MRSDGEKKTFLSRLSLHRTLHDVEFYRMKWLRSAAGGPYRLKDFHLPISAKLRSPWHHLLLHLLKGAESGSDVRQSQLFGALAVLPSLRPEQDVLGALCEAKDAEPSTFAPLLLDILQDLGTLKHLRPGVSQKPDVSVIITVKDNEEGLRKTLSSLEQESDAIAEILILDDHSRHPLKNLSKEFCKVRLRQWRSSKNLGPYSGRNFLLDQSTGKFIAFQDAGDLSVPGRLKASRAILAGTSSSFVRGSCIRVTATGCGLPQNGAKLIAQAPITIVGMREDFLRFGGFLPLRTRGDVEFIRRVEFLEPGAIEELPSVLLVADEWSNSLLVTPSEVSRLYRTFRHAYRKASDLPPAELVEFLIKSIAGGPFSPLLTPRNGQHIVSRI